MDKNTDKTYTLTEAYSEILKIKTEMVGKDYEEKNLNEAYKRGYHQAIKDMEIILTRILHTSYHLPEVLKNLESLKV